MKKIEIAIFGGGCFWCTEAVFESLQGVISVVPGYAGGKEENPTYKQVSEGATGHAEVIKIEFNPEQISYSDLLMVFFATHDPTTLNRQGNDVGTQYRSIILYTTPEQKETSEQFIKAQNESLSLEQKNSGNIDESKIVTEIKPLEKFYEAEEYHHQYYKNNSWQPYCQVVINPKLQKLKEKFKKLLKSSSKSTF